ncbi:YbaB/EbfC family nucleoid-associated protein [Couchioplanes caeruleus]|uniref:YbaB/EbfC DNA-binding family protein n=2 Tax=Couchioplanes caeruleus TaxID=56438 RepID=A0A1K0H106_9ACTN|nr:YbaB/EbfC family nucleoid-associated protein [Couchioplanes caeruleus]OJF15387.1 hypothetical protein BG844_04610 [Couchioplanes caeruleus subsp. caeruleus]ROP33426.1 YbaB/EbfC DNA-binding family protein [Couchioplanes caeruleus]
MRDIDAAEDWLESWAAGIDARAEQATRLARQVAELTATERDTECLIAVTVGSSGQVLALELDDRACNGRGSELSDRILAVMRAAQSRMAEFVAEQVRGTVGAETETGRAVVDAYERRFPAPPPEQETHDGR